MTAKWSLIAQCEGKRPYLTKSEAKDAARSHETRLGGGRVEHYRCPHCDRFHIGHARFKKKPR